MVADMAGLREYCLVGMVEICGVEGLIDLSSSSRKRYRVLNMLILNM